MKDKNMNFIKGMGAGVVTGVMASAAVKMIMTDKSSFTKKAGKTMKAVGNIAESINCILK